MSHTNSTTNYGLPQFLTGDKPAWLTDINGAFSAIDTGIYNAQDKADDAAGDATQALSDAAAASSAASTADSKGSGAVASIAHAFDSSATYAVNDLVMYNNLLYRCKNAVTNPGSWTGTTNWQRVVIAERIPENIGDLKNVNVGSASAGQLLSFNGTNWVPTSMPKTTVTSQINFEENYSHATAYEKDGFFFLTYQGELKTHSASELIMTIPAALRPPVDIYLTFVDNAGAFGNLIINHTTGEVTINQISSNFSGRLYFTALYPL